MKKYDLVIIGTGSAMNLVDAFLRTNRGARVAVIDKDEPGGICLTRGCIPTKLLVHVADVVRHIESAAEFGIDATINRIDFARVMRAMREHVDGESDSIRKGLSQADGIDFFREPAAFTAPRRLRVGGEEIEGDKVLLCTGSKPHLPRIEGLDAAGYHTSDSILHVTRRPKSLVIVGGGYIAAEFGHFFAAMGTQVTILGRNAQFLPAEEPEVSAVALAAMRRHMRIETGMAVSRVTSSRGTKKLAAASSTQKAPQEFEAEEILVATGRSSNSDVLAPEKGGIRVDKQGWIVVDEFLRTSQEGVWALGDAAGVHQFKHKANYDSMVVWQNAFRGGHMKADYSSVPHAVFSHPEVAGVGLGQEAAVARYGRPKVLIGHQKYEDTAKGSAMHAKDYFVKVLVHVDDDRILGAHIVGPYASILIQEVINVMAVPGGTARTLGDAMHIHPALPEVVDRAFGGLMTVDQYDAFLHGGHLHHHG